MAETETHPMIQCINTFLDGVAPYTKTTSSRVCRLAVIIYSYLVEQVHHSPDWDELGKAVMRTRFPNLDDKTLLEMWELLLEMWELAVSSSKKGPVTVVECTFAAASSDKMNEARKRQEETEKESNRQRLFENLNTPVLDLQALDVQIRKVLHRTIYRHVGSLALATEKDLHRCKGIGQGRIDTINEVLRDMGLRIDAKKHGIDLMDWKLQEE